MSDAEFGANELCKAMGVSRSVLHRKLKALANTYTTSFIRTLRLHKARQLLKKTENSISGVAYDIGYFSRVFRKEFVASPRAFREGL